MIISIPILEQLNLYLFQLINAPVEVNPGILQIGTFFARDAIVLFPLMLFSNLFWRGKKTKKVVLVASLSMLFSIVINVAIEKIFMIYHLRPFMIPLGQHFLSHPANNSFPSNHMSLSCAISFSMIISRILRWQGIFLFVISIVIAWARIYMGVHFPLDMAGSLVVACISVVLSLRCSTLVGKIYTHVYERFYSFCSHFVRKNITKK
ncbi:undecaprenyl-diphosphatase [Candidatus Curculioniphilus buchneri]|uniref:undecaprenyl-diphosphatase n=1 Tax=Candidatus Curculioniphilus buchneri TaxID=690594 RepID=UPI00376EDC31